MGQVANNFAGTQLLLVLVMVGGYAVTLGGLVEGRMRLAAAALALFAMLGFTVLSASWQALVLLAAFVPVGMGFFAGAAWLLWTLTSRTDRRARRGPATASATLQSPLPSDPAPQQPAVEVSTESWIAQRPETSA